MQKTKEKPWHEQDDFWGTFGPVIFNKKVVLAAPQEVEQLVRLLHLQPGSSICDMCCGVGRHSLELARRGFKVAGVDRTTSYLQEAKKKADAEGLDVQFINEDVRDFCRPDSFDAVLNLYTSFGYFEKRADEKAALENIYNSLKSGGKLVIELVGKEVLARIFQERDWREEDGIILLEERKIGENWDFIESRWILIKDSKRFECKFYPRLYSATELCALLISCGFKQVETYGGVDGSPYDQTAKRLVVVAHK
ncbi:MAG: class I SAM-dependent methyltransferase [Planctomycetota bacterium]|jgi:SAM-dependent methyltransferase